MFEFLKYPECSSQAEADYRTIVPLILNCLLLLFGIITHSITIYTINRSTRTLWPKPHYRMLFLTAIFDALVCIGSVWNLLGSFSKYLISMPTFDHSPLLCSIMAPINYFNGFTSLLLQFAIASGRWIAVYKPVLYQRLVNISNVYKSCLPTYSQVKILFSITNPPYHRGP